MITLGYQVQFLTGREAQEKGITARMGFVNKSLGV